MTVLYRALFTAPESNLTDLVRTSFDAWLKSKGLEVDLVNHDAFETEGFEVSSIRASEGSLSATRVILSETIGNERWTTTAGVIADGAEESAWIDLEHTSADPFGPAPDVFPPGLVNIILENGVCRSGPTELTSAPVVIDEDQVDLLFAELMDESREVPVVVLSKDRYASASAAVDRGTQVLRRLTGIAVVRVLEGPATNALATALDQDLQVVNGAVRAFLPGMTQPEAAQKRHPLIAGSVFGSQPAAAAVRLQRSLTPLAIARRLPAIYRERVLKLPGFSRAPSGERDEELLAESIELESERDELAAKVVDLQHELEFSVLQLEEAESELDSAQARVRYLEGRLRASGDRAANEPTPLSAVPDTAESCMDSVGLAMQYLASIDIGDTEYAVMNLDTYMKSSAWARKAWRAFRALQDYADLKEADGFEGDFLAYCDQSPAGRTVIPAGWVAMKESESTDTNPKYRSARTFPVPAEVAEDETAYMCAHIKLEAGKAPAPRIHFFDDTAGPTGKIYIGYFGEHLPSDSSN